jgi:transcriptional antiterminator NusG
MGMWYVMQVQTGMEETIRQQCQKQISKNILEDCFIPYYEEKKKYQGRWHIQNNILFPGYVFAVTDSLEALYYQLKKILGLTRILGTGDTIVPLREEEVRLLQKFGGEEQIVPMSEGIIENSQVIILSGPLEGMEGYIKKIDRHKRKAYLEIPMFGGVQTVEMGLEVAFKTV